MLREKVGRGLKVGTLPSALSRVQREVHDLHALAIDEEVVELCASSHELHDAGVRASGSLERCPQVLLILGCAEPWVPDRCLVSELVLEYERVLKCGSCLKGLLLVDLQRKVLVDVLGHRKKGFRNFRVAGRSNTKCDAERDSKEKDYRGTSDHGGSVMPNV